MSEKVKTFETECRDNCRLQERLNDEQLDSGKIPRSIECELLEDLVDSVVPGDVVIISGIVKVLSTEEGDPQCIMYQTS
jgi:DNA helicase MCM8